MMKPDSLSRRVAGNLPGVLLGLAVLPLAALGQANYATPYTFITLAGRAGTSGSADGTGSAVRFNAPGGAKLDSTGNLYVADSGNHTIRKVTPTGVVTTLAGLAGSAGSADGMNSGARFNAPIAAAVDSAGNLYVSDWNNNTIRKVTPLGTNWVVTTLAGQAGNPGSADGTNSAARFNHPSDVAVDTNGNVYVSDWNNNTIRKVTPLGTNWVVTTLAGLAGSSGSADGTNSAARFNGPSSVAVDSAGNVYVSAWNNNTIRKVTPLGTNWVVTTLAGLAGSSGSADGTNSPARFNAPADAAVDSGGNVYVSEFGNSTIRKMTPVGTNWVVITLAGLADSTWQRGRDRERRALQSTSIRGGGQRGQPVCRGHLQRHDSERISRQLRAGADFTAAEPERRPVWFWNHRSSRPGGEHRVFRRFVPVAGGRRHLYPQWRDELLCQYLPIPERPVLPRPCALTRWSLGPGG